MDDSIYDPVVPGCMLLQYDSENEEMQSNAGTPMGSTGCLLFLPELDTLVMLTCSRIVDPTGKAVQSNRHAFSFGEITAHAPTVSAVMRPANWIECTQQHPDDVPLIGIADPVIGSTLTKRGAGTRLSSFVVTNVGITHHYYTPQGFLNTVYGSIRVSSTQVAFAFEDIGSVAHTASGEVVGMIYDVAENRRVAWMTPIQPILDAFSATFYVQPDITETVLSNPNRGHTALASPPGLCTFPLGASSPHCARTFEHFGTVGAYVARLEVSTANTATTPGMQRPGCPPANRCKIPDGGIAVKRVVSLSWTGTLQHADVPMYGFSGWLPSGGTNDASWDGYGVKWRTCTVRGVRTLAQSVDGDCTGGFATCVNSAFSGSATIDPVTGERTGNTQSSTTAGCTPITYDWYDDYSAPYSVISSIDNTCLDNGTLAVIGTTIATEIGCNNCIGGAYTASGFTQGTLSDMAHPDLIAPVYSEYDPPHSGQVASVSLYAHTPASTDPTMFKSERATLTLTVTKACPCSFIHVYYVVVTQDTLDRKAAAGFELSIQTDSNGTGSTQIYLYPPPFPGIRFVCRTKISGKRDVLGDVPLSTCTSALTDNIVCCGPLPYRVFPGDRETGQPDYYPAIRVISYGVVQEVFYLGFPIASEVRDFWGSKGFYLETFNVNRDGVKEQYQLLAREDAEPPTGPFPCGIPEWIETLTQDGVTNVSRWLLYVPASAVPH